MIGSAHQEHVVFRSHQSTKIAFNVLFENNLFPVDRVCEGPAFAARLLKRSEQVRFLDNVRLAG
jgi:hypothetical protein